MLCHDAALGGWGSADNIPQCEFEVPRMSREMQCQALHHPQRVTRNVDGGLWPTAPPFPARVRHIEVLDQFMSTGCMAQV